MTDTLYSLILCLLLASHLTAFGSTQWGLGGVKSSSDFMLSNNSAFWSLSPDSEQLLVPYLKFEGWVLGDPHPENFGFLVSPDADLILGPNDFDDGGEGPFILDLIRLVSTTQNHSSVMKLRLVESYKNSLCGLAPEPPAELLKLSKNAGAHPPKDFKDDRFIQRKRSLYPLSRALRESFRPYLPAGEILDSAITQREKGGSFGLDRFWFLIKTPEGKILHIEFKTMAPPATSMFQGQKPHLERIESLKRIYWPSSLESALKVVEIQNAFYLLRIRHSIPSVYYPDQVDLQYLMNIYWAALMGFSHGKQESGKAFCGEISEASAYSGFESVVLKASKHIEEDFSSNFKSESLKRSPIETFGGFRYRLQSKKQDLHQRRIQQKIRAYAGFELQIMEDLKGVFSLSTYNNPTSRNADLGDSFSFKDIQLNLAHIDWTIFDTLNARLGKMNSPQETVGGSELVFDSDLAPEGISLQFQQKTGHIRPFINFGYFMISENYKGKKLVDEVDNTLLVGQLGAKAYWRHWTFSLAGGPVHYTNIQGIAFEDLTEEETGGNSSTSDDKFQHNYHLKELQFEIAHQSKFKSKIFAHLVKNSAVDTDNEAFQLGLGIESKKWETDYSYRQIEKDSVFGYFSESSFGTGNTDVSGSSLSLAYKIQKGLKLKMSHQWVDLGLSPKVDRMQRTHLDINFRF